MEGKFELQFENNEYYLVDGNSNDTVATTDKVLLKEYDGYMKKLSLKNCQAIENGYDLDELARDCEISPTYAHEQGFITGFQKAIEILGDKKFSIEDIQNVIDSNEDSLVYQTVSENGDISFCLDEDVLIQSLQQTEWDVEVEMECVMGCQNLILNGENSVCCGDKKPKLDTDGCLILKRK